MNLRRIICGFLTFIILATTGGAFADSAGDGKEGSRRSTYLESLKFPDRNTAVSKQVSKSDIRFTVNGQQKEFNNKPYIKDSEIMAPAKELFESFGVFLGWEEDIYLLPKGTCAYVGEVNGAMVAILPDSDKAWFDEVPLELTTATVAVDGDVYIPLYFIQFIYGMDMKIDGGNVTIKMTAAEPKRPKIVEPFDESKFADAESEVVIDLDTMIKNGRVDSNLDAVELETAESDDGRFDKVLKVKNITKPNYPYENQAVWMGMTDIAKGDVLLMEIWARSPEGVRDEATITMQAGVEIGGYPWTRPIEKEIQVPGKWTRFVFVNMSAADCSPTGAGTEGYKVKFKVGYRANTTYEIGYFKITNYKKSIKPEDVGLGTGDKLKVVDAFEVRGAKDDALWREEALRRIEKYRKESVTVNVVDEKGEPVRNAAVGLDMTENEFMFGWELQDGSETTPTLIREKSMQEKEGFNTVVPGNAFKSPYTEYQMSQAVQVTDFARETNSRMRGHALIYEINSDVGHSVYAPPTVKTAYPLSIANLSYDEVFRLFMSGMSGRIVLMNDYVDEWDAINETKDGVTPLIVNFGYEMIQDLFECARLMIKPEARLYYLDSRFSGGSHIDADSGQNEIERGLRWNNEEATELIGFEGFKLDGMGAQLHTGRSEKNQPDLPTYIRQMEGYTEGLDNFAVTEYDFVDLTVDSNVDTKKQNEVIGAMLRDFVIATFANPKATCFSIWDSGSDMWQWRNWGPFTDLCFQDKPENLKMWLDLIKKDFASHTNGETDENGAYTERVFRGDYDVNITVGDKTVKTTLKVTNAGENTVKAIVKPDGSIETVTSERVTTVADRTKPIDIDWFYNNYRNMQQEYLKFSESEIASAVSESGKELPYILNKDNRVSWVSSNEDNFLVLEMKEPLEKGYITVKWPVDRKALYMAEGSPDGENWERIAVRESEEKDIIPFYGKNYRYVRLSNMSSQPMAPYSVAVYRARYFAKTQ